MSLVSILAIINNATILVKVARRIAKKKEPGISKDDAEDFDWKFLNVKSLCCRIIRPKQIDPVD